MHRTRILIVDDDPEVVSLIQSLFGKTYDSRGAANGIEALKILEDWSPDLVVLDLVMGGLDGFTVCHQIRERSSVPVLVLSGRQNDLDKVRALDLGADDYLTKPFSREELLARVRALLRRSRQGTVTAQVLQDERLQIDFGKHLVTVKGIQVRLTPIEYGLLEQLASNPGKLMTHAMLLHRVWGPEYHDELDYVRVFVRRLRRKIEPDPESPKYILTEPRVGYRFRNWDVPLSESAAVGASGPPLTSS
jgi:two-component system, OmpR family, KDP operon response regulator KdpE